jgi:hypothetical protein
MRTAEPVREVLQSVEDQMNGITVQAGEGMMFSFKEKKYRHKWAFEDAKEIYARFLSRPDHAALRFDAKSRTVVRKSYCRQGYSPIH